MLKSLTSWQVVVLTLVVACIGIAPTFVLLWPKWVDSHTYSHGLIVAPLCLWLLWRLRDQVNSIRVERTTWAIAPLLLLVFVWTLSYAANIVIGTETTMPLILLLAVLAVAGLDIARLTAFPILLIYSAVTVWDFINGILQSMTVKAVTVILSVLNVPAFIQGNSVQIPSGWFEIAGGCSGLHFLIVGLTLAAIYGYLYLRSFKNQLVLVAIMGAMCIVMNWVRVATIITAGHLTDMQSYLVQVDHYTFGWVLFAVLLIPFFLLARRIERTESRSNAAIGSKFSQPEGKYAGSWAPMIFVVLLLPTLVWGRLAQNSPSPVDIELPAVAGWSGPTVYDGDWRPRFPAADGEALANYRKAGQEVQFYVNWYQSQSQGRELIGYGNSVTGPGLSQDYDRKFVDIARTDHAKSLEIREIMASSRSGDKRLIWYYFRVGNQAETNRMRAQLSQGLRTMLGADGTGLVAISVNCAAGIDDCAGARRVLENEFEKFDGQVSNTIGELLGRPAVQGLTE